MHGGGLFGGGGGVGGGGGGEGGCWRLQLYCLQAQVAKTQTAGV